MNKNNKNNIKKRNKKAVVVKYKKFKNFRKQVQLSYLRKICIIRISNTKIVISIEKIEAKALNVVKVIQNHRRSR